MTRWFYLAVAVTAVAWAASLYLYFFQFGRLPERVPTHWNFAGRPDVWTARSDILPTFLLVPAIMLGFLGLTLVLPWLSPRQFDVDRFRDTYGLIMALAVALMAFLHLAILWASLDPHRASFLPRIVIGGVLLFFVVLGGLLPRVRRNFWIGIRTPWTLASDEVWDATHRLAARLFVGGGLICFAMVLFGVSLAWCFAGLAVMVVWPVVYSLVLYKRFERLGRV